MTFGMPSRLKRLVFAVIASTGLLSGSVHAGSEVYTIQVVRGPKPLSSVTIASDQLQTKISQSADGKYEFKVRLEGKYTADQSALLSDFDTIPVSGSGDFEVETSLRGETTPLKLISIDGLGQITEEILQLKAVSWAGMIQSLSPKVPDRWLFVPGVSLDLLQYRQGNSVSFDQWASAGKITAYRLFSDGKYAFDANLYGTLMVLSSTSATQRLRTIGVNARLGTKLYSFSESASLWGQAGIFFVHARSSEFGYVLFGPQVNPVFRYRINARNNVSAYFKFAPLNGFQFEDRELAVGFGWGRTPVQGRPFGVGFDYSHLTSSSSGVPLTATHILLGVSVNF